MGKIKSLLFAVLFVLFICNLYADKIIPVGELVAVNDLGVETYVVDNGDIKTGYRIIGNGEPLMLLMGLGGTMDDWPSTVVDMLSDEYQVVLVDNRGMGFSTDVDEAYSYEMLAEDIVSFMDVLGIEKSNMLGYSMGSIFIQHILLNYPQRIDRAILHATAFDSSDVLENLMAHANAPLPPDGPVKKQLDIASDWKVNPEMYSDVYNDILLIAGTADTILDIGNSEVLAGYMRNSWLVKFKGLDHYMMYLRPVDFSKVVLNFLNHLK